MNWSKEQAPSPATMAHNSSTPRTGSYSVEAALKAAEARFIERNPKSKQQHEIAARSLPGGNTRTILHTTPFPLVVKRGKGSTVWDEDGHQYTDFVGEMSAAIYGHSHPVIHRAILSTLSDVGLGLGSTTVQEQKFAALLCARFRLGRVRFANSGTEANLHAINAAKAFTGKSRVAVFGGGYHGALLMFPGGEPAPNNVNQRDWVVGEYNSAESARRIIEQTPDLAAVLVEGMQGAAGCVVGRADFLRQIERSARKAGVITILDEVQTSRLAPGGLQSLAGLTPDLTTLGKYLGGGFAFGGFGGRADVMAVYDPRRPGALAHSGTFNNNTMAMHAGHAGLAEVLTPEAAVRLGALGDGLRRRLAGAARGTRCSVTGLGSLMHVHFSDGGVADVGSAAAAGEVAERADLRDLFWFEMLEEGFWLARRGAICLILDTPEEELDRFVDCVARFLERHRDGVALGARPSRL